MGRSISTWIFFTATLGTAVISVPISAEEPMPFRQALPDYNFRFPRDFFSHNDFKVEWWYYTGNLQGLSGRRFGYQLTFFRVALDGADRIQNPSQWKIGQIYFAHMTVTDIELGRFFFFERINRKAMNNAGARSDRLFVWNEDWILTEESDAHRLKALQSGTGIDLFLIPDKNLIIHGENGVSQKGEGDGNASHYFSYTRMRTKGRLWVRNMEYQVTGTSWMDHEFSSNQLNKEQVGWDWFSIKLDNNIEIMLYQIRLKNGGVEPLSSGTLVEPNGSHRTLSLKDFQIKPAKYWISESTYIEYPAGWRVDIPTEDVHLKINPDVTEQELFGLRSISSSYWEGSVSISGHYKGYPVKGNGYVELVGYGKGLNTELPDEKKTENKH